MNIEEIILQIGTYIREKRESIGISQRELARKSGISSTQISLYEGSQSFNHNISVKTLNKICEALDSNIFELFEYVKSNFDK